MSEKLFLTLSHIRSRCDNVTYQRGQTYYRQGALTDCVARGNELFARCQGSRRTPYRVWARLGTTGPQATSCTCPYDWGGDCKHIAALLLAYFHTPEKFARHAPTEEILAALSKEELIKLVERMVRAQPSLLSLVERLQTGAQGQTEAETEGVVDVERIRRELKGALDVENVYEDYDEDYDDEWMEYEPYDYWGEHSPWMVIGRIAEEAQPYVAAQDWPNAAAIYCTILEECTAVDEFYDENGEDIEAVNRVVEQLGECLAQSGLADDDVWRRKILLALLGTIIQDIDFGGVDYGYPAEDLLRAYARPQDIPPLRAMVQAAYRSGPAGMPDDWRREALQELMAELDMLEVEDPDELLRRLEERGHYLLQARKLLELGREDEAIDVVRARFETDMDRPGIERAAALNLLCAHGLDSVALTIAEEMLNTDSEQFALAWLIQYHEVNGNRAELYTYLLKRMETGPDLQSYLELRRLGGELGRWEADRPALLEKLARKQSFGLLTRIFVEDKAYAEAWRTLEKVNKGNEQRYYYPPLDLHVAQASHKEYPELAMPVYVKYALAEIDKRQRAHYAQAAAYLAEVHEMCKQSGNELGWSNLIGEIRSEYHRLRALQDELNKAGL